MIVALKPKPRAGSKEAKETLKRIIAANLSIHEIANLNGAVLKQLADNADYLLNSFIYPGPKHTLVVKMWRRKIADCSWLSEQLTKMYTDKVNAERRPMLAMQAGILRRRKA